MMARGVRVTLKQPVKLKSDVAASFEGVLGR